MSVEILFIRLLESCNSNCEMCAMAASQDRFRLEPHIFKSIVKSAQRDGIRFIRFTGGEPLLDKNITLFVRLACQAVIKSSIITNGLLLEGKTAELSDSGLDQIIVSLDGPEAIHDHIRGVKGIFNKAVAGLIAARNAGIHTRVNTVCGPKNYQYMPYLQDLLTDLQVEQWELSSVKLERPLEYSEEDIRAIEIINATLYEHGQAQGKLVPMGKRWSGETESEKARYFSEGITPRPDVKCHVVDQVRYINARDNSIYVCSLLPHRKNRPQAFLAFNEDMECFLNADNIRQQADYFKDFGPSICTGCSTTAAGLNNKIRQGHSLEGWYY